MPKKGYLVNLRYDEANLAKYCKIDISETKKNLFAKFKIHVNATSNHK